VRAVKKKKSVVTPLRQSLAYPPVELAFGTSGLRGRVRDITHIEAYVSTRGFLAWSLARGEAAPGGTVFVAGDLRPSTTGLMAEEGYRGDILQAVLRAIADAGLSTGYCGAIPTPALVLYAMGHAAPGIMITGSHIPFDRNGIKFTRPGGEVLKDDEAPILAAVRAARETEYARSAAESIFDEQGMLRSAHRLAVPPVIPEAREEYVRRYVGAFPCGPLAGRKLLAWQHSAVGRDILADILAALGADVTPVGRSDGFVAVDTEAVSAGMLSTLQALVDANPSAEAVVSTDGDGDRPLLLAVEDGRIRFIPGDLLGLLAAGYLGARHVAVPVSVNDAVDAMCPANGIALVKTRIGSPHVIAAMREVGWESNGGFLTAAPVTVPGGGTLSALPTRDAMLPLLCALYASLGRGMRLSALMDTLPKRYGSSTLLRDFAPEMARELVRLLSPADPGITEVLRSPEGMRIRDAQGERALTAGDPAAESLGGLRERIERYFTPEDGFAEVAWVSWRDGVRIGFTNGDVAHMRPSGNAPEMRFYANAGSMERAEAIAARGVADDGILRHMERDARERMALDGYRALPRPVLLAGAPQRYAWGGRAYIPGLLGLDNGDGQPFAEIWMGAHPRAPAVAQIDGARIPLDRLIAFDPWLTLGSDVALRFAGRLPYLFKVLDVRDMASIQAHPSKAQAEEGFSRENEAGIPIDAAHRNYRDDNHKPEVHVVLTDFWMLHGFRPLEEIGGVLASVPELAPLMPDFSGRLKAAAEPAARAALLRDLYARVMTMPQPVVDSVLDPLVARLESDDARGSLGREDPGFWALRAARTFPLAEGHRDRGIVSIFLLNLVHLKPGQGTFQPAGTLHAYLEGADVELMANSDNVLRGGLTPKHVDVAELLSTLSFRDGRPPILEGRATSETSREYETPAEEFSLERIEVSLGVPYSGGREHSADCLIVIEGTAAMIAAGRTLTLPRGSIVMVPALVPYSLAARAPKAVLFKAGVPLPERA
jgi:mannose-6-phosphate isomerase class I